MQNLKKPRSLRSKTAHFKKSSLAVSISAAIVASPISVHANDDIHDHQRITVEQSIKTNPYAEDDAPYKAKFSGDDRYKRELAEIPKTITVLTKEQIEEAGYTDLRQILDRQPGITLGTGENGNQFGDRYIIRGQEARSDVFVDGLRDPGMTIRESFATEQVEITKGPDSSFGGRGTSGGAVNSITKKASVADTFSRLSTGFGTDRHTRLTLDHNQKINDDLAVRANLLYAYEQVPGRAPADRERQGIALSGVLQATDRLEIMLDYYKLEAKDKPDLGYYLLPANQNGDRKPAKNVPVYLQSQDFQNSEIDTSTLRFNYEISNNTSITNATRFGTTNNAYLVTGARQGSAFATLQDAQGNNNAYAATTLSAHHGWQEVDYWVNSTLLHHDQMIAGKKHEFIFGLEYSDHRVLKGNYAGTAHNGNNCFTRGRGGAGQGTCVTDENGQTVANVNNLSNRTIAKNPWNADWQVKTLSASIMDTVDVTDKLTLFAGIRADKYDYQLSTRNNQGVVTDYDYSDTLWNYHLGATYKIRPNWNVYASFATASEINGGESDVGTSTGYGGLTTFGGEIISSKPETSRSLELGTKWNAMDGKLLLAAAIFQIEKSDVMEGAGYSSEGTFNTGANRVQGIELSASGNITDKLSAQAGAAFMKAEVTKSVNEANVGKTLSNFSDNHLFTQLKYQATPKFAFGGVAKYQSVMYAGQPDTAARFDANTGKYTVPIPEYTVVDAFASYNFNKQLTARLNVNNLFDTDYFLAGYQSGAFLYKGDARNVRVTLNYDF